MEVLFIVTPILLIILDEKQPVNNKAYTIIFNRRLISFFPGEFETAIKHFEKAVSLNHAISLKSLAKLYGNTGDIDKAEHYWLK